jgi:small-conductance mechanosensitive channel
MVIDFCDAIVPVRDALHSMVAELETRPDMTESILESARAGAQRADQIAARLAALRHAYFAQNLFRRSQSVMSPYLWLETTRVLPTEIKKLYEQLKFWSTEMKDAGGLWRGTAALLVLTLLHTASKLLWSWWRQRINIVDGPDHVLAKALAAFGIFFCIATAIPIAVIAVSESFGVRIFEVTYGFYTGAIVAAFGQAVAVSVLAPDASWRRLIAINDRIAHVLARGLSWGTKVWGLLLILVAANNAVAAPPAMQAVAMMLFSLVIAGLLIHLLVWTHRNKSYSATVRASVITAWLRIFGWLALAVIAIALITGYARFAAFVAELIVSSAAVLGALYLFFVLTRELFVKAPLGEIAAANFGISQRWLGLAKGITASGICLSLTLTLLVSIVRIPYVVL